MNLYKREIYKSQLQHGLEWKKHKYLYKDANGNYVYPEDVKNKAKGATNTAGYVARGAITAAGTALSNMKDKASNAIADQKQNLKDKKYVRDSKQKRSDSRETLISKHPHVKKNSQLFSAHQTAVEKRQESLYSPDWHAKTGYLSAPGVKEQIQKTDKRKEEAANKAFLAERKKINQQRKSAHAGYEADKKLFPEGGSTEELEIQKDKTAARKKAKAQAKQRVDAQRKSAHVGYEADRKKFPEGGSTEELEKQKEKTRQRKWKEKSYPKQKYSADQAERERSGRYYETWKESKDNNNGYAASPWALNREIENTKKRKKAKQVRALYNK